jgi:hypothetical protein
MIRPGYRTTEFWLTLGTQIAALLNLTGAWDWASNWHSGILATVATAVYAIARGLAKHGK